MLRKLIPIVALVAMTIVPFSNSQASSPAPNIKRVFVYVLENTSYDQVVGNKQAPYLNSLIKRFTLATNYTATGHASTDNYIAMTSGQRPNPATMGDCMFYATPLCIQNVPNIGDQMEAAHLSWKGYMDSMARPCMHTKENSQEKSQNAYAPRHNPFMYYRDIVDNQERCDAHVVPMTQFWKDQASGAVPDYSFITPDTCHDGHDSGKPCKEGGGIHEADRFSARTIPKILGDPSWKDGGLLILTFDEGGVAGDDALAVATDNVDFGGHVYTLLAYPNSVPGRTLTQPFDHYALLKTVEDLFCLSYIGNAALPTTGSMLTAIGQRRCSRTAANATTPALAAAPASVAVGAAAAAPLGEHELAATGPARARTVALGLALAFLGLATLVMTGRRNSDL